MLEELSNTSNLSLALSHQTKDTQVTQSKNRRRLYEEHRKLDFTSPPEDGYVQPLIWLIKNNNRKSCNWVKTYTFSIFDGAGEDHENILTNSSQCRYIAVSEAIMFLIDPMILQSVQMSLSRDVSQKSTGTVGERGQNSVNIVNDIAHFIKISCGLKPDALIKIPVAVIFTKMDTLMNDFKNRPVAMQSPHGVNGFFNQSDARAVDNDIRSWLDASGESSIITALRANFSDFRFFGVSSFGSVPITKDRLAPVLPHRVLDPILWLFAKKKFIDAK
jgi:hypothetical protein